MFRTSILLSTLILLIPGIAAAEAPPKPDAGLDVHVAYLLKEVQRDRFDSMLGSCKPGPKPGIENCESKYHVGELSAKILKFGKEDQRGVLQMITLSEDGSQEQLQIILDALGYDETVKQAVPSGWKEFHQSTESRWLTRWTECEDGSGRVVTIQIEGKQIAFMYLNVGLTRPATCSTK